MAVRRRIAKKFSWSWIFYTFIPVILMLIIILRPYQIIMVYGNSMSPTLKNNHMYVAIKREPKRNDIVIFHPPDSWDAEDKVFVKRLVGLPGDIIEIDRSFLRVNDEIIYEFNTYENGEKIVKIKLLEDQAFVLGDNFPYSQDSLSVLLKHDNYDPIFIISLSELKYSFSKEK